MLYKADVYMFTIYWHVKMLLDSLLYYSSLMVAKIGGRNM